MLKVGVIGTGHWFERLYIIMSRTPDIKLTKVAGISPVEKKRELLARLSVPTDEYYQISADARMPGRFFDGIDLVHISDPNEFHASQTMQAVENGKITITEKTFGVSRSEFTRVVEYIRKSNAEGKVLLHLHYLNKQLTLMLPKLLKDTVAKHGKITGASATFFERESDEDARRSSWLFSQKSGGLFMDWGHPFEVYYKGAKADTMLLNDVRLYASNEKYSATEPTGIEAHVSLGGALFSGYARSVIRVAKGVAHDKAKKAMRFVFEDGAYLDLSFVDSEIEFRSDKRGEWRLHGKGGRLLIEGRPSGKTTSEFLVDEIMAMGRGESPSLSLSDAEKLFEPQWRYQEIAKSKELVSDKRAVSEFLENGFRTEIGNSVFVFGK